MKKLLVILFMSLLVSGCIFNDDEPLVSKLNIPIQTDGKTAGLYLMGNRYVYRGSNPDNYIMFNNQLLRIMAFENDDTIKIIAPNINTEEKIPYDSNNNNEWTSSTLNDYLNNVYYKVMTQETKNYIISQKWGVGSISFESYDKVINDDINYLKELEAKKTRYSYVSLLSMNDYISSLLDLECLKTNTGCKNTYINGDGVSWIINTNNEKTNWIINYSIGLVTIENATHVNFEVQPVFYLKSGIKLKGKGTVTDPFIIK